MKAKLDSLTQQLLDAARKAGADNADALAVAGTSLSIDVLKGALEHAERSEGVDIGLRVMVGHRQANVSASDTSADTIEEMAQRAVAMAREAPEDPTIGLADPSQYARDWDLAALELADPSDEPAPDALEEDARTAEQAALGVEGVSQVQATSAGYGRTDIFLATSNGFAGGYGRTTRAVSLAAISGTGAEMEREFNGESRIFQTDLPSAEEIGRIAGERAAARKGAKQPPTGTYPVLFDERVSASIIGHLLGAINGASIVRGSSFLRDRMGQQVLPAHLSIIEDPLRVRANGSRPFDGEGLPTGRRALVENGVLNGWVLDLATARKLGLESTANAGRGTGAPPSPGVSNMYLTPGDKTHADLMSDMGTGLLVTGLIGSTVNPNTGDYSRGASGFWVENGEIAYPVNECTIANNLIDMLLRIIPANDAEPHKSRQVPSLLIEGMTLAGS
ncbi:microcin-processing peptidase 1 [Maritimibacter alkaliphilus HTCC2654]|uniref:Putative PmbA/TldD protein n=1 Tax=Maritimibacter alkaliphilus HTCC2654 TaxID=314271 RepID=A3VHE0_9RHOB|nr:TldD/PmbA family protein [Maritimibacter alkaliphilus]EAQ12695.1 Putative PmbA/TldD protein [Rhodobacterales bacterium HTCC2654] [Maritimibacter alkaliphilus HTCC2654]TYP84475.1 microcin-processing peptidase 1 [Maritimibacter alkaliphilus HTCC2654]